MNQGIPVRYIDPVFRPPSEAKSLILPVTDGCSWNKCSFCEMYTAPQKKFRARDEAETLETIRRCGERFGSDIRRVFLADGDALVLPTRRLSTFSPPSATICPRCAAFRATACRATCARSPWTNFANSHAAGLTLAYVGAESGDDEVLARVNKGETFATTRKPSKAGGGRHQAFGDDPQRPRRPALWQQHAANSARLVNAAQPEYLATLVVSFPERRSALPQRLPGMGTADISQDCSAKWSASSAASNWRARCSAATMPRTGWYSRAPLAPKRRGC